MLTKTKIQKIQRKLEDNTDERIPLIFSALGDPGRFRIFKLLQKQKDICVTDIANILDVSVPAASQQLKILERTGLIRGERTGQTVCYCVKKDDPLIRKISKLLL